MELENEVTKASEDVHGGKEQRLEPVVEAASLARHEDDMEEEPEAEQASEASPGPEAAEEPQERGQTGLEPVHGHVVGLGAHLQLEGLRRMLEHKEQASVEWR